MIPPKIKVGVNKPRRGRIVADQEGFGRVVHQVKMRQEKPVFRTNKLLQFFWTLHPTKAAIDATYSYLKGKGLIRENPGAPVLPHVVTREEKLAVIRGWYERRDQDVAFDFSNKV